MHLRKVVFIDVADNPHRRKIGDGEGRGTEALHTRCIGDLLIDDHPAHRRGDIDHTIRFARIVAEQA